MTKKYFSNLLTMLMVAMLSFGFASCSSDDDEVVKTTYTLKWNTATYGVDDVTLFEYTESGDKIATRELTILLKMVLIGLPHQKELPK